MANQISPFPFFNPYYITSLWANEAYKINNSNRLYDVTDTMEAALNSIASLISSKGYNLNNIDAAAASKIALEYRDEYLPILRTIESYMNKTSSIENGIYVVRNSANEIVYPTSPYFETYAAPSPLFNLVSKQIQVPGRVDVLSVNNGITSGISPVTAGSSGFRNVIFNTGAPEPTTGANGDMYIRLPVPDEGLDGGIWVKHNDEWVKIAGR